MTIIQGFELFFMVDDDDEEMTDIECKRQKVQKVEGFAEILVWQQSDVQFKSHFRVSRETYEWLVDVLRDKLEPNNRRQVGRERVSAEKQVMMGIWTLANGEVYRYVIHVFSS